MSLGYSVAKTPEFLVTILPVALLLALLYTLTNHARHNEITAMRAAGISLWRICAPYLAVGLAASAVLFALNESLVPHSMAWADRILHRYVPNRDDIECKNGNPAISTRAATARGNSRNFMPTTAEMISPKVSWTLPDGKWQQVQAERAVFTNGVWTFFNATSSSQLTVNGPLVPMLATNVLAMPEFTETPKDMERDIRFSKYEASTRAN